MKPTDVSNWINKWNLEDTTTKKSKKEISQDTGLSDNTVYETMKAAHMDTKATSYSYADLEPFIVARRMLDEGKNYAEVDAFFAALAQQEDEGSIGSSDVVGDLQVALFDQAQATVTALIEPLAPYLPVMLLNGLLSLARSKQSTSQIRTDFIREGQISPKLKKHLEQKGYLGRVSSLPGSTEESLKALPPSASDNGTEP